MRHRMGYEHSCTECEKACRDEDIADWENGLCRECYDHEYDRQEKLWRPVYEGERLAGFLPRRE